MKKTKDIKSVCIIISLMALLPNAFAKDIAFAFKLPARSRAQARELASVSIGIFQPEGDSPNSDYRTYRWQEYVCVSNAPLIHSLNTLLDMGSTNINLASLSGTSYDVLFFGANESVPRRAAGISRSFSWVSVYACRQDLTNGLVYAVNVSEQVNPIWVGLVYGTLVRYNFDAIQRERDIFHGGWTSRSFEDSFFGKPASEAFEKIYPSITNKVGDVSDEAFRILLTNGSDFIDVKTTP